MTAPAAGPASIRDASVTSRDGTVIAYHSLGRGPGLVIVGGVLFEGSNYLRLAGALAGDYAVHVMERCGRPGSGPQRAGHSIADECDDLAAVAAATGATLAFGHSFGGLVTLETARTRPNIFSDVVVYEPGVPVRGNIPTGWFDGYQRLLERGDRRGAFSLFTKQAGAAPAPVRMMPVWYLRLVMRMVLRGQRWASLNRMLEANLAEHRAQALLDAPDASRFSAITARTVLLAGDRSPDILGATLLGELAAAIPRSEVAILPGLSHLAPEDRPDGIAAAIRDRLPAPESPRMP